MYLNEKKKRDFCFIYLYFVFTYTADPRVAMVRENPSLVRSLLAVLHEVYWSSAGPAVRSQALKAILRCVYYADAQLLRQVLKMQVCSVFMKSHYQCQIF